MNSHGDADGEPMADDATPNSAGGESAPTVGEAVVDCLIERGVDTIFGIPGKQTLPLNRALAERDARFVIARHETAVTHQAWGYAESSDPGALAATVVVPGPGDMNAMNGLKNALNDCVPMVHIAVETERDVRGGDGIHETPPDTYDNVVKENVLVDSPAGAVAAVADAVRTARQHPQGPVRVGIPKDVLASNTPQATPAVHPQSPPAEPAEGVIETVAETLLTSSSPVVIAGGGVRRSGATHALREVAERLDAPVVTTYKGKGTLSETHPLSAGVLCGGSSTELRELLATSDVVLAVGSDLDAHSTGNWSVPLPDRVIHVTLDGDDIGFGYEADIGTVADADRFLSKLVGRLGDQTSFDREGPGVERAGAVRAADRRRFDALSTVGDSNTPLRSVDVLRAVRETIPSEAIVTADAGGFRLWTLVSFPAMGPSSYVNPGSWATMGTGLPSAMGAKLANPEADVVAVTGDGGLLMCIHELHTLASEGIDLTVVALNNDDYAIISEEAERSYGFEQGAYGWSDVGLDLCTVATGMGVSAERVHDRDALVNAVGSALKHDGPSLVEVITDAAEPQASEWMTRG